MTASIRHVDVALPVPVDRTFTYSIEGALPTPGTRVLVPFRRTERVGWVVGPGSAEGIARVRPVLDVLDDEPAVPPDLLRLCRWMAAYYLAPPGLALRVALPAVLSDASRDYLTWAGPSGAADVGPGEGLTPREARLARILADARAPRPVAPLRRSLGMGSLWPEIRSLKDRGLLRHETVPPRDPPVGKRRIVRVVRRLPSLDERERVFARAPRQRDAYELLEAGGGAAELAHVTGRAGFSRAVVAGLERKGLVALEDEEVLRDPFRGRTPPPPPDLVPTPDQERALGVLRGALDRPGRRPFVLHGVTGSGKTLVYIELLRDVLARGRSAIVLVPEISLTPQTVSRFRAHFGDQVAVLHSALSAGERYDAWRELRAGRRRIAVGARSAVFAPLARLGAIVVDEEHDGSYKQSDTPRYHARDVAVMRAAMSEAVCVLGSATPSLESWANARRGKSEILSLPRRVGGGQLPPVKVLDLREVRRASREGSPEQAAATGEAGAVLSPPLVAAVRERLRRREQVILLLNRRGYSTFVQCRDCGDVRTCVRCSVSLTYHRATGRLVCHHCRHEEMAPERCLRCGSPDLSYRGLGTEQVERIVVETFPEARVARMDVDTTSGKWSHHEILGRVERGEVDLLLGTQMIAKGLDFPRVTLVGVVNADVGLHLPDFRASERTFQLLSQVAGRAGRGSLGGEVLVQTSLPQHYAIQCALAHDYEGFAERELRERAGPAYPPHVRLVNVVVSSPHPEAAADAAEHAARWLRRRIRRGASVELVGPAPSPIERLHGRWRWHFFLRSPSATALGDVAGQLARDYRPPGREVRIAVDRDPQALL